MDVVCSAASVLLSLGLECVMSARVLDLLV